jgi:hypothetical protein
MLMNGLRWNLCFGCNKAYHVDSMTGKVTRSDVTSV